MGAEKATKIPKECIALGGGLIFLILVVFGIGASLLCSIVGFAYPAYKSFQCIENRTKADDTQWLIYWVVYAFFSIIEVFTDVLLYWIPFYYTFKMAFLVWAMLPQTKGAKYLYDSFLKDFLKKNESKIDKALSDAKKSAAVIVTEAGAAAAEITSAAAKKAAENLNETSNGVSNDTTETEKKGQ